MGNTYESTLDYSLFAANYTANKARGSGNGQLILQTGANLFFDSLHNIMNPDTEIRNETTRIFCNTVDSVTNIIERGCDFASIISPNMLLSVPRNYRNFQRLNYDYHYVNNPTGTTDPFERAWDSFKRTTDIDY